ncbi:MAG TPA: hypothetical protein VIG25_06725 [Pyrinomonadaceae bacterium]
MNFANVYVALDDKDTTFEWLEEVFAERNPQLRGLKISPVWDALRFDPALQRLTESDRLA